MRQSTALRMPAWAFALMLCSVAVLAAAAGGASTSAAAISDGLVAAYSFDEGSGQSVADTSGNGNNGTISGASWTTAGKNGSALSFDGSSSQVTVADSPSLDLTDAMTLEAWVKPDSLGSTWRTVVVKEQSNQLAYALYAHDGGPGPSGHVYTNGDRYAAAPSTLPTGTWSHLAATYDGSAVKVYVNGTLASSNNVSGPITTSGLPLRIGGNSVWSEWFSGQIDDVRIYNRALDASELASDMATPVGESQAQAARPRGDKQAPSAPGNVRATGATQTSVAVAWNASSDDTGVSAYGYYRNGSLIANGSGTATSYTFSGLACGTSYALAVDAVDAAGNRSGQGTVSATTSACSTSSSGLVGAYSFDQGAGQSVADDSGTGNGGTISGATWTSAGKNGGALSFGRAGDQVTVPDSPSLDLTSAMTLEAWIRPSSTSGWQTVVTKETAGNLVYGLFSSSDTPAPAAITTIGGSPIQSIARGSAAVPANAWTHLAATYDGANLKLFVGGTQVGSTPVVGSMAASTAPLRIGGNSVWPEWFSGQIDDLRIYNVALTPTQIQKDMTTPVGGSAPPPPQSDTQAPTAPGGLAAGSKTQTSIAVSWNPSSDNVGVTGYGRYLNGTLQSSGTGTTTTYSGLTCGTTYTLGVDAYDAAGNRSTRTSLTASTAACSTPPSDTQAPTAPGGLTATSSTQSAVAVSWNASADNVGVTGYGRYLNGTLQSSGTGTTYTYSGLTCGTSYTLGLDAYDAAGNRSTRTSITSATAACSPPAGGSTANLWVDANGGSCTRSASPAAYADAKACSWNGAYQAALSGDLVLVKGGSYGNVRIGPNRSAVTSLTFRTAPGESATVGDFENGYINGNDGADNVTFVGPVNARTFRSDQTSNVTVDGWNVDCGGCANVQIFHLEAGSNILVKNSEISDNTDNSLMWINGTNLTFENNRIHDAGLRSGSGAHTECMYAWSVTNLTLKRNHFYHCSVMDVFITGNAVSSGGYVEQNVFERPWSNTGVISQTALAFHFRNGGDPSPDPSNWDFRYNTFVGPLSISSENPVGSGGMRVVGNVFLADAPCGKSNTTYAYNAFVSGGCGTGSTTNSLATYQAGFTAPGDNGDYSLKSGSVLREKGDRSSYPTQDMAGTSRYVGAGPDIGAYEGK